ncbi:MAG: Outer membrane protein MIP [Legionellaceae bacterium]
MKLRLLITVIATSLFSSSLMSANTPAPQTPQNKPISLTTDNDKFSYAIGWDIGDKLKKTGFAFNTSIMSQGLKDALNNASSVLTEAQRQEVIQKVQKELIAKKEIEFKQIAQKNKQAGEAYLNANKVKPAVKTTVNGLQYHIIKEGTGVIPTDNDEVIVDYQGKLLNGDIFESSYKNGKPAVVKLSDVISGWKEALKMMKVGSEWEIVVPPNLAYGATGITIPGSPIGPNQTLIFTIKLNGISNANAKSAIQHK